MPVDEGLAPREGTGSGYAGRPVRRNTTHEFVCLGCGVSMKGREVNGEVRPSNAAPSGEVKPGLCRRCSV